MDSTKPGRVYVGRIVDGPGGLPKQPSKDGYTPVVVMMKSYKKYYPLSPYALTNEQDHIMENIWQFSKVYEEVPKSTQRYSRYDARVIWEWPNEVHYDGENLTKEYWKWRKAGMSNLEAVRYPVGFNHRHKVLFSYHNGEKLDYVESRKKLYLPLYTELVKEEAVFDKLQERHLNGENLLIIEVDGPHQESLEYYQEKYDVSHRFIKDNCIRCNRKNLNIMLNDLKHPFGHGYCLAAAIQDINLLDY